MENKLTPAFRREGKAADWVELVVFLSDRKYLDRERINEWCSRFHKVTVAGKGECPSLNNDIKWYSYSADSSRSEVWNHLVGQAEKDWVLFVEDDEQIQYTDFPSCGSLANDVWVPALIKQAKSGSTGQFYQMRLVNTAGDNEKLFQGKNLPDCTRYIRERNIELVSNPIVIKRKSDPFAHIDIDEELSVRGPSPKLYLVQGERYFRASKYVRAAAQYRQLLKKEKLLPFDRLAGVNGLASCLAEQHKWTKAMTLTEESIRAEKFQALPYLIQFKIYELKKEWQKAQHILQVYYQQLALYSKASFDKILDEEKALVYLSDIALKAGDRKSASNYFDELFTIKTDKIDRSLLYKVLILSIDLCDYERSVHLFNRLFKNSLPHHLDDDQEEELNGIMGMFIKNEWYTFVVSIYTKLHNAYPENQVYKRRLIVALTKTNRLDKARNMLSNIV